MTESVSSTISEPKIETTGEFDHYQVAKGETLMLIAFKIYGDYMQWKKLYRLNQDQLKGRTTISVGMQLKYEKPAEAFVWNPEGLSEGLYYAVLRSEEGVSVVKIIKQ